MTWVDKRLQEMRDRAGQNWLENKHKGSDVAVRGGPCDGQRVSLPVIYGIPVLISLKKAYPLRLYWQYQYDPRSQTYNYRSDLPSLPRDAAFWLEGADG